MSERKLRELGKRIMDEAVYETIMGRACTYCGAGTERRADELVHEEGCLTGEMGVALALDLDVVAMLRWARHQEEHTSQELRWDRRGAFRDVARAIEVQFHVRLTEDGYEWTDA